MRKASGRHWQSAPALIPFGVGIGTGNVSSMVAATEGLSPHMHGASTGIVNTGGQVGNAMGLAILTAVSEMRKSALLSAHGGIDMATATVEGYKVAFLAGAGVALLGISALLIVGSRWWMRSPAFSQD